MSDLEKAVDALLAIPVETLAFWAKQNPQKFASLRDVVEPSLLTQEAINKAGDIVILCIDKDDNQYSVRLAGIEFRCDNADNAMKLFKALQNVF